MFKNNSLCRSMLLGLLFLAPVQAFAVSTISIIPAGTGVFLLQGSGLAETAGIDLQIFFDEASLSNPRITQGSLINGAMTTANVNLPGVVRLSVIGNRAINGSGSLAIINFDRRGTSPGKITSLSGTIIDMGGKSLPLLFSVENPPDFSGTSSEDSGQGTHQPTPSVTAQTGGQPPVGETAGQHPFIVGGTLTMPKEENGAKEQEPIVQPDQGEFRSGAPEATPAPSPEPSSGAPAAEPAAKMSQEPIQSVLERFRLFKGERTIKTLTALFATRDAGRFTQNPAVMLADGKGTVKVTIFNISGDKAPNFAFTAARAVSLKVVDGGWLVEAKPDTGTLSASINVLTGGGIQEFPLAVAPAADVDLDRSGSVTEADFLLFLKEQGPAGAPKFDLNGDGKRDYLDDYIFTANYLVVQGKPLSKEVAQQKPAKMP